MRRAEIRWFDGKLKDVSNAQNSVGLLKIKQLWIITEGFKKCCISSEFEREVACEETDRFILSAHNMEKVARYVDLLVCSYVDFADICVRCHMPVQVGHKLC